MNHVTHIIFDLDGTLTDTLEDLWLCTNHALVQCGMPKRSLDEVRQFVGNGIHRLIERAVPEGTDASMLELCFEHFRTYYVAHCQDHTAPYPGIQEMLDELYGKGYKLAIVSNKLQAGVDELHRAHFAPTIDIAIGEHEGVRRKPAPDMVLEVMDAWGVEPGQCVYIGDSEVDLATARNAGLPCISVLWGFRDEDMLRENGGHIFATAPSDIPAIIASL